MTRVQPTPTDHVVLLPRIPDSTDHLGRCHVVCVVCDQAHDERSILAQVVDRELSDQL